MPFKSSLKLIIVTVVSITTLQSCFLLAPYGPVNIKKSAYYKVTDNDSTKLSYDTIYSLIRPYEYSGDYPNKENIHEFNFQIRYLMFYKPNVLWADSGTLVCKDLPKIKKVPTYEYVAKKRNYHRIGCYKIEGDSIFFDNKIGHNSHWLNYAGKIYSDSIVLNISMENSKETFNVTYSKDSVKLIYFDDHKNK